MRGPSRSYAAVVFTYEYVVDGEARTVLARTWRRDLDTGEVVFVQRDHGPDSDVVEREVLRILIDAPHANVRRL